jgi:hypothetical protein
MKMFDWSVAKAIEFCLVEMLRFVPNSLLQARKIVKLRYFYAIVIQKNASVTSFRKNILRKTLKIEFCSTLRPGQNCNTSKNDGHFNENALNRESFWQKNSFA